MKKIIFVFLFFITWFALTTFPKSHAFLTSSVTASSSPISLGEWPENNLLISKYVCPEGTQVTTAQRPDSQGNALIPEGCSPASGYSFGYIYQPNKPNLSPPYPGLDDATPFTPFSGLTNQSGQLFAAGLSSQGRYMLAELDDQGSRVSDDEILGFLCTGDQGIYNNNYEATFIPENGLAYCNVFNLAGQPEAGDVVINELMWMGSTVSGDDEWIELRNTKGYPIDLSGWQLTSLVDVSNTETLMLTIPSGSVIPANGYFLISNFDQAASAISVEPDLVDTNVVLRDFDLQIKLYKADWTNAANLIDTADDSDGAPLAGFDSGNKQSMERNNDPSTGWHTCIDDLCNDPTYWDVEGNNYGTPGAANHSENDPTNSGPSSSLSPSPTPIPTPSPLPGPAPIPVVEPTGEPTPTPSVEAASQSPEPTLAPEVVVVEQPEETAESSSSAEVVVEEIGEEASESGEIIDNAES